MRKIILGVLIFELVFNQGYCQDNLLAVDIPSQKEKPGAQENKIIPKEESQPEEDTDKDLNTIRAYREFMDKRQKELENIRFDLEKSDLLLKKKENEKKIYNIEKDLPEGKKDGLSQNPASADIKELSLRAPILKYFSCL